MVLAIVGLLVVRPGTVAQPNEAFITAAGGRIFASTEDEIASVQAGQVRATPELWVAGTSMTLLTVDAKLMPILPLIARPDSQRALVVAFGMGTAFRSALIAGLRTDVVELVPSVPDMFGFYYPDADAVLADPDGRIVVADGRNHLELATERFDIILTDPPPPIESSGASVISSLEYYLAGRDHLTPGGVMMQWVPFGAPEADFKEHIRTFASVFPNTAVIRGRRRLRRVHAGLGPGRSHSNPTRSAGSSRGPASSRTSRLPTTRPQPRSRTGSRSSRDSNGWRARRSGSTPPTAR